MFRKTIKFYLFLIFVTIMSSSTFGQNYEVQFTNISIDTMGLIKWTTNYTQFGPPNCTIIIERFNDNKWIEVEAIRSVITEPYTTSPKLTTRKDERHVKFHTGVNKYRIRMIEPSQATSQELQLTSKISNDDGNLWISGTKIFLDEKEYYEIINQNGKSIQKGEAKTIDISSLDKGSYFLYTKKATKLFAK